MNRKEETFRDIEQQAEFELNGRSVRRKAVIEGFGEQQAQLYASFYFQVKISASNSHLEAEVL